MTAIAATVVRNRIPTVRKPAAAPAVSAPKALSKRLREKLTRQRMFSYAIGGVALTLTALSLSHLAEGVGALTHSSAWHSWAMAAGIDLGFICLELGQLVIVAEKVKAQVERYARPAIIGTLLVSALMNAYAFGHQCDTLPFLMAACALGIAVPALVYVLTRVSVAMWLDTQR